MKPERFEKYIDHLSQKQVVMGATRTLIAILEQNRSKVTGKTLSALNKALIRTGVTTEGEIQQRFTKWMEEHDLVRKE